MAQRKPSPAVKPKVDVTKLVGDSPVQNVEAKASKFTLYESEVEALLSGKAKVSRESRSELPAVGDVINTAFRSFTVLSVEQKGSKWNVKLK